MDADLIRGGGQKEIVALHVGGTERGGECLERAVEDHRMQSIRLIVPRDCNLGQCFVPATPERQQPSERGAVLEMMTRQHRVVPRNVEGR